MHVCRRVSLCTGFDRFAWAIIWCSDRTSCVGCDCGAGALTYNTLNIRVNHFKLLQDKKAEYVKKQDEKEVRPLLRDLQPLPECRTACSVQKQT
jgi:hypothetical protein